MFVAKDFPVRPACFEEANEKQVKVTLCDKKPTVLVEIRALTIQGKTNDQILQGMDGRVQIKKYTQDQPNISELYLCNFSTVDIINKLALDPNSLSNVLVEKLCAAVYR